MDIKRNKKILFVASTTSHIINFHLPYLKKFKDLGWQVDVVANRQEPIMHADNTYALNITKKILSRGNLEAICELSRIIKKEEYDIISVHTTLAAVITRLAALKARNKKSKIVNTVHGFLFCKNQPFYKNAIYFTVEVMLAPLCNKILTMNREDFEIASKYMKSKDGVYNIPGIGIELEKINIKQCKVEKNTDCIVMIYIAEFSNRKNQEFIIRALKKAVHKWPKLQLIFLGSGKTLEACKKLSNNLGVSEHIQFLGYVDNPYDYLRVSDIAVSSSISEGLPFNIMEAMNSGLPILASRVKGHTDLIEEGKNGYLFELDQEGEFLEKLDLLCESEEMRLQQGKVNKKKVQSYKLEVVLPQVMKQYQEYICENKE